MSYLISPTVVFCEQLKRPNGLDLSGLSFLALDIGDGLRKYCTPPLGPILEDQYIRD